MIDAERKRKFLILDTYCRVRDCKCKGCVFNEGEEKHRAWCRYKYRSNVTNGALDNALRMITE